MPADSLLFMNAVSANLILSRIEVLRALILLRHAVCLNKHHRSLRLSPDPLPEAAPMSLYTTPTAGVGCGLCRVRRFNYIVKSLFLSLSLFLAHDSLLGGQFVFSFVNSGVYVL